jgi:hypothetical protein
MPSYHGGQAFPAGEAVAPTAPEFVMKIIMKLNKDFFGLFFALWITYYLKQF